jgi:hypothetical protein
MRTQSEEANVQLRAVMQERGNFAKRLEEIFTLVKQIP